MIFYVSRAKLLCLHGVDYREETQPLELSEDSGSEIQTLHWPFSPEGLSGRILPMLYLLTRERWDSLKP